MMDMCEIDHMNLPIFVDKTQRKQNKTKPKRGRISWTSPHEADTGDLLGVDF